MTREECLKKAQECVMGQREQDYGSPEDNFRKIANLWNSYLGFDNISDSHYDEICSMEPRLNLCISPKDVAMMMALMKIARASGVNATDDCFVDLAGYSACAAEIFEKDNEDKTDDYIKNPYSYFHNSLVKYASAKAKEKNIPFDNLKSIDRKLPREFSDLLHQAAEDCVSEGKYGGMKLLDYYKKIDELFEKYKPEERPTIGKMFIDEWFGTKATSDAINKKIAESRSCSKKSSDNIRDFFKQVAPGTVTNKEEFEKCCNDQGQFDACMTAYPHYIYNKAKEATEVIDKCMHEQKDPYSYAHDKLVHYVSVKAKEKHVPLDYLKAINHKFPIELSYYLDQAATDCVINGLRLIDCYKEIDEIFAKHKELSPYRIKKKSDKEEAAFFWQAYNNISAHIALKSSKANVNPVDVVDHLTRSLTEMASLLTSCELDFDDVAAYVDDAINEVKKSENKNADNN